MSNTRYPYTYACDLIRAWAGYDEDTGSTVLSRAQASKIRQEIAKVLNIADEDLAVKLADYFKTNEEELGKASFDELKRIFKI